MTEKKTENSELRKVNAMQLELIGKQSQQIDALKEQLGLLQAHIFGKKSEKKAFKPDPALQMSFLDAPEAPPIPAEPIETIQVQAHSKKKKGRKPLPENLPRRDEIHDISEADNSAPVAQH